LKKIFGLSGLFISSTPNKGPSANRFNLFAKTNSGQQLRFCVLLKKANRVSPQNNCGKRIGAVGCALRRNMEFDEKKVDNAVLALLYLTLHDGNRAWKGHDWDALDRLHKKGYISNPATSAKSVVLTEEGLRLSEQLFGKYFGLK
jgi:hypothetical protein